VGGEVQASPPDPPTMPAAVALRGITKRFPAVVANDQVDFEAAAGEVHALLGENGAGKTTLSNILTGLYRPDEGEILLAGGSVEFHSPRDAIAAGIAMVHQHFRLVSPFTVAENVILGDQRDIGRSFFMRTRAIEARVEELSLRYGLAVDPRARIWQLSVGEQQRVEVLKALYQEARILILDEPTAVLTPQEADALFETVRAMAADGRTVIFISHKLHEVKAVADRVTVLRRGRSLATVPASEATPRSLAALMVGREVEIGRRHHDRPAVGEAVLELDSIWADGDRGVPAVKDVSLSVRSGEIVAVAGVAGNGQRELAETIVGMRPATKGTVEIKGRLVRSGDPRSAISARVAYVPEDRLGTGVAPGLSIASNVVLKSYRRSPVSSGPFLRFARIRDLADRAIDKYDVRTSGCQVPAWQLSGGNVQKVVLAREFSGEPDVLIAASPTRGLDVSSIETVHSYLREAASAGVGVLLISEDLDEILALADRIAVMYEGGVAGERDAESATVEELGLLMAGGQDQD
jgi:general nucleoside transport system ATP-binding protein